LKHWVDWFIVVNGVSSDMYAKDRLRISGRLSCQDGLFIDVDKTLEVREDGWVRTIYYKYHVGIDGPSPRSIFRYDNAHTYAREGQPDEHHKHIYDWDTGEVIAPPTHVGRDAWPHLSDVIEETFGWWQAHRDFLAQIGAHHPSP
jgi:hypothetical protein